MLCAGGELIRGGRHLAGAGIHIAQQLAEPGGHPPERVGEIADLVARVIVEVAAQVPASHFLRVIGHDLDDRLEQLRLHLGRELHVGLAQARHGGLDGGERRAQVVADRRQQTRAELVHLGELVGLAGRLLQLAPFERVAELGAEGGQHVVVDAARGFAGEHHDRGVVDRERCDPVLG